MRRWLGLLGVVSGNSVDCLCGFCVVYVWMGSTGRWR